MSKERVVVTGLGAVSPFGGGVELMWSGLKEQRCPLGPLPGAEESPGLGARTAGLVPDLESKSIPRTYRRSMSKMAVFSYLAAREALKMAGLADYPAHMGLAIGTTMSSPATLTEFFAEYLPKKTLDTLRSTTFFKIMGHGPASSLALALGLTGRTLAPSAACAAGLQAVGLGYEAISAGREELMLCGGTEEFDLLTALTFDQIMAASHNPDPLRASRPFDQGRDGLVCSEGAGVLLLESLSHARKRGAPILAEIAGFATSTSPANIVHPDPPGIALTMKKALADSGLAAGEIQAVNAHATATVDGDRAEGRAIAEVFGGRTPVLSFKGLLGHTMAASGALELVACVRMIQEDLLPGNYNLDEPDSECADLQLPKITQKCIINAVLKNSFALGGVNASLILRKFA